METKEYCLRYFSKLDSLTADHPSINRKLQTLELINLQKNNLIYNFRKKRATHRTDINCIYLEGIKKYCFIMPFKYKATNTEVGCLILDDEEFVKRLNLETSNNIPKVNYNESYSETILPSAFEEGTMTLEEINIIRAGLGTPPMTEEEFKTPLILRYLNLPILEK